MAEHIDRSRLGTDLRYQFDYVSKFLNFTSDDISILNALAPIIFPRIPSIVETVYKKLHSFDLTKQYFIAGHEPMKTSPSDEEHMRLVHSTPGNDFKDALSLYLKRILLQTEWNDTFLQYVSEMGDIQGIRKNVKEVHFNYIHINMLFGYLEHSMIETIWKQENFDSKKKRVSMRALNKFFWIQNNLFTMNYGIALTDNPISNCIPGIQSKLLLK